MNKKLERCSKCEYFYCNPNVSSPKDFMQHQFWITCKNRRFAGRIETIWYNNNSVISDFFKSAKKYINYPKCFKAKETTNNEIQ